MSTHTPPYIASPSGQYVLLHDGKVVMHGTEGEIWKYIHNVHPYSVDHALKYEGYKIQPDLTLATENPPAMSKGTKTALMIGGGATVLGIAAYFLFFRSSAAASNTQTGGQAGGVRQGGGCGQGMLYDPMTRKCVAAPHAGYHMPGQYFGPPSQLFNQGGQPVLQQIQSFQLDPNNLNPKPFQTYVAGSNNPFMITPPAGHGMISDASTAGGASIPQFGKSQSAVAINLDGTASTVTVNWTYYQSGQPDQSLTTTLTFQ